MTKIEIEIPEEIMKEVREVKKSFKMKSDEDAIIYLIKLGLGVFKGIWVPPPGAPPEKTWREAFPEIPKPEPYWPRSIKKR